MRRLLDAPRGPDQDVPEPPVAGIVGHGRVPAQGEGERRHRDGARQPPLTVKNHLNRLGRRLGNGDRAHLVLLALRGRVIG